MTWIPLLLADPSPCLRRLVLRELLGRPEDDPEVQELAALREGDPLVEGLLAQQAADGSWGADTTLGPVGGERLRATGQALARLGYLGFGPSHPAVHRAAEYLFACQAADGGWPLLGTRELDGDPVGEDTQAPLQTALPLRALALAGYAADLRAEKAYEWLLAQRLPDGAWPTGSAAGVYRRVGGYRRLAHSRWGCRSNTTGALLCLAHHPTRRTGPEARRALDLLLGRETREAHTLGFEVACLIGLEPARGFLTYFARYDLALILDLAWRVGATREDERVAEMVEFVESLRGPFGLWQYPARPQASRWVTCDLLRSLSHLDATGDWLSFEPRTPFRAYTWSSRRY